MPYAFLVALAIFFDLVPWVWDARGGLICSVQRALVWLEESNTLNTSKYIPNTVWFAWSNQDCDHYIFTGRLWRAVPFRTVQRQCKRVWQRCASTVFKGSYILIWPWDIWYLRISLNVLLASLRVESWMCVVQGLHDREHKERREHMEQVSRCHGKTKLSRTHHRAHQ